MLFSDIIIGPIKSRRLGISLGVNLLPVESKICNFDCIYCECGWNADSRGSGAFSQRDMVIEALEERLKEMATPPDVITFAGNGEPTLHPDFEDIIDKTIALRDTYAPSAKVAVLSNATRLHVESVRRALLRVDKNILKIDAASDSLVKLINKPHGSYSVESVVELMRLFEGELTVQTMLLRGHHNGVSVDNTDEEDIRMWIETIKRINPHDVMLYSLDRTPPCSTLERVSASDMELIADQLRAMSIECSVAK